ncbi:MAG: ABC transporter ATP-binding protein [Gammaproteobacteria bacterium]|nr:ABC transporter ATP-binding protein [Gammaproteobacteria bacterium]
MNGSILFETRGLGVSIAGKCVSRGFSLELHPGSCIGILGNNGVGKTTLLHSLAGLRHIESGEILLGGKPLTSWPRRQIARRLGLLMQQQEDSLPATVLETALIGRHPHIDFWRWESHRDVNLARRALKLAGLDGLEQRPQTQLSGGERRRLAIATIITQDPGIFLLDEPTHQLDPHHQLALLDHFTTLAREHGRAVVMSLHDANLAARYCGQVLLMFGDGDLLYGKTGEILTAENLSRLYQTTLIAVNWTGGTAFVPI